jgi:hypothetical protein
VFGFNKIPFITSRGYKIDVFAGFENEIKQESQRFLIDFPHAFLGRRCLVLTVGHYAQDRIHPKPSFVDEKHILKRFIL